MICKASHNCVPFFDGCNTLVPIPPFLLAIIVWVLQLSFGHCGMHGYVVSAKKSLMDIKGHSMIILHTFSLFIIYISICVHENLQEDLIHWGILNLECMTLPTEIYCVEGALCHLEVQCSIGYGGSGNHILVKVHISIISRWDMCHLDILPNHRPAEHPSPSLQAWCGALWLSWSLPSYFCLLWTPQCHLFSSVPVPIDADTPALFCWWHDECHNAWSSIPSCWT